MRDSDDTAHLETIQDRLHHVSYIQMLAYLRKGKLSELAREGARGAAFAVD